MGSSDGVKCVPLGHLSVDYTDEQAKDLNMQFSFISTVNRWPKNEKPNSKVIFKWANRNSS